MIATSFALSVRNNSQRPPPVRQSALHREPSPTLRWLSDGSNPEFTEKSITAAGWSVARAAPAAAAAALMSPLALARVRGRLKVVGIDRAGETDWEVVYPDYRCACWNSARKHLGNVVAIYRVLFNITGWRWWSSKTFVGFFLRVPPCHLPILPDFRLAKHNRPSSETSKLE